MKITDDMLTEWFPGDVKPVRSGVYAREVFYIEGPFSYYDAERDRWYGSCDTPEQAKWMHEQGMSFSNRRPKWKGLKEKHHG
ncbi:hypothetical protein [Burkholderia ubonensis]|uniref:hypothetical protein n=1 Tax=Burkholderia ubonensis TaxID=101571 RepID=UPI000B310482|nr:hypothetical protein [Burkholderia ubonensis]